MKGCLKRVITCVSILVFLLLLAPANVAIKKYRLKHLDHAEILAACREAIANRASYRNDKNKWGTLDEDDVLLLSPIQNEVPVAIRKLHPANLIIRDDNILINFKVPFARISILGFQSGAPQYGTTRYIDGLWFWNGNDATAHPETK